MFLAGLYAMIVGYFFLLAQVESWVPSIEEPLIQRGLFFNVFVEKYT